MRHGAAEAGEGKPDGERALTREGTTQVCSLAHELGRSGVRFDGCLSSPLLRARQTARLVWREMALSGPLLEVDALRPGAEPSVVLDELARLGTADKVLIVGHMPDLSDLARHLLGSACAADLSFTPGTMTCIDFVEPLAPHAGALSWRRR